MIRYLALASVFLATPAFAQDPATGEDIRTAISGNTVAGNMSSSGAYTEYYSADGAITGEGYSGTWTVEGDTMCFTYGEGDPTCWGAVIQDDQITWMMDGEAAGSGTIVAGNPNAF